MSDVFRTRPEHAIVHPSGWHPVNDDFEIVKVPLIDATAKLSTDRAMFARVSHHDEEEVCRRLGAEFVTFDIAKAVWRAGVRLKPVQLVRTHADSERMRGRGFCEVHDARVWNQLEAIGWDGSEPVANIGKFWVKPSSKMARNCGWFDVNGVPVQPGGPGSERHDRDYTDYSQLCYVVRRRGAQTRDASSALGSAVGAVESAARAAAAWLAGVLGGGGQQEEQDLGSKDEKRTAMAPWQGPSHGYRCSVAELYRDAVALGSWVPIAEVLAGRYVVQLGDLVVSARAGGDPTKGGPGHVERARWDQKGLEVLTIGGNEGNRWALAPLRLDGPDVRGIIRCDLLLAPSAVAEALAELEAGVAERSGAAHHPRIQEYHAGARRGGSPLAGMPGHEAEGFAVLGTRAADEIPWCASSASWCAARSLVVG